MHDVPATCCDVVVTARNINDDINGVASAIAGWRASCELWRRDETATRARRHAFRLTTGRTLTPTGGGCQAAAAATPDNGIPPAQLSIAAAAAAAARAVGHTDNNRVRWLWTDRCTLSAAVIRGTNGRKDGRTEAMNGWTATERATADACLHRISRRVCTPAIVMHRILDRPATNKWLPYSPLCTGCGLFCSADENDESDYIQKSLKYSPINKPTGDKMYFVNVRIWQLVKL